jgi:hypothetical protein
VGCEGTVSVKVAIGVADSITDAFTELEESREAGGEEA